MPSRYFITPYDPASWDETQPSSKPKTSDLEVHFFDLATKAKDRFPNFVVSVPTSWYLKYDSELGVAGTFYGTGRQILSLETGKGIDEFILWYRSYIPSDYLLYLFVEGEFYSLLLTIETTISDIYHYRFPS